MLLITLSLNPQTAPPSWTGEAKAFAVYLTSELLPNERVGTVYVARRTNLDGSTITLVKTVPLDNYPTARLESVGEGIIERDRAGSATHVATRTQLRGNSLLGQSEFKIDAKKGILTGWGSDGGPTASDLTLPDPADYFLDPTEALAFGSKADLNVGWLLPVGTFSAVDRTRTVGLRYDFRQVQDQAVDLAGKREMFHVVNIVRNWIGSSIAHRPEPAGNLYFHYDGSLAAYVPLYGVEAIAGRTIWAGGWGKGDQTVKPPPFQLNGKLAELWNSSTAHQSNLFAPCCILVPAPVTAGERAELLAALAPPPPKSSE